MSMFTKRLDKVKYDNLYSFIDNICKDMGITKKIKFTIVKNKVMTGFAYKRKVEITKPLINMYAQYPFLIKLVMAHELSHIKNNDYRLQNLWINLCSSKINHAKILLRESRADIEAAYYSKLTNKEIDEAHMILNNFNNHKNDYKEYKYGYASRERRSYYSQKYHKFDNEAFTEILNDYCNTLNIKDAEKLIKSCKKYITS